MNRTSDPELLSFAARVVERLGGLVERGSDQLLMLLPEEAARLLELPEEAVFGRDGVPLLYGSPVLDRLIRMANRDVPIVYGRLEVPYLKKGGFDQLISQDLAFTGGQHVRVVSRAETRTTYMVLFCHYVALSDERKEGLTQVAVQEGTGAVIPELEERWSEFQPHFFEPGKVPPHFPVNPERAVSSAMKRARTITEAGLSGYFQSMRRRLHRDMKNTREYYETLKAEMEAGLRHPNLTEGQRRDRMAKIEELPGEMDRKIEDLCQKYKIKVSLRGCAALRFLVTVVQIMVEIRYRGLRRSSSFTWNPITRQLDPLTCECCHETIRTVYPGLANAQIGLFCASCSGGG
jgi:hypothetical protein